MNVKKIVYIIFIIPFVLMNSCASKMFYTTLDVLKPAEVTFPLNVNNVVIVNNSVPQPSNIGHFTTSLTGNKSSVKLDFDSAAIFAASSLRDAMISKSFFNRVELSLTNQNLTNSYDYINTLSTERVKTLCKMYNTDAVIALNKVTLNDNVSEYYLDDGEYYNELEVKVKTNWSIYYLDTKTNNVQFVDSFLWQSSNFNRTIARDSLPKRYDALVDASILSGSNIAERMIPRWEKEDRYFFVNKNKLMTQAMDSVPYRKWEQAIELWKKATEKSNSDIIKYQAYNNIAISYEILGDIDKAKTYAIKAFSSYSEVPYGSVDDGYKITDYYRCIVNRKTEMAKLKQQLGN